MMAVCAAEQLIDGDAQLLAQAVVQRDVNRGDGSGQCAAALKVLRSVCSFVARPHSSHAAATQQPRSSQAAASTAMHGRHRCTAASYAWPTRALTHLLPERADPHSILPDQKLLVVIDCAGDGELPPAQPCLAPAAAHTPSVSAGIFFGSRGKGEGGAAAHQPKIPVSHSTFTSMMLRWPCHVG
jgi:hypothetical protein